MKTENVDRLLRPIIEDWRSECAQLGSPEVEWSHSSETIPHNSNERLWRSRPTMTTTTVVIISFRRSGFSHRSATMENEPDEEEKRTSEFGAGAETMVGEHFEFDFCLLFALNATVADEILDKITGYVTFLGETSLPGHSSVHRRANTDVRDLRMSLLSNLQSTQNNIIVESPSKVRIWKTLTVFCLEQNRKISTGYITHWRCAHLRHFSNNGIVLTGLWHCYCFYCVQLATTLISNLRSAN